jgi:hypothetical protein
MADLRPFVRCDHVVAERQPVIGRFVTASSRQQPETSDSDEHDLVRSSKDG